MINYLKERIEVLQSLLFDKTSLGKALFFSCAFSAFLSIGRVVYTKELAYIFLNWNLFLAYLPFAITRYLSGNEHILKQKWRSLFFFLSWLLLIPNSFYIITDLVHLRERTGAPLWYDVAMIFSFAWNGLLLGILSLRRMETMFRKRFTALPEPVFLMPVIFLNALGIYIGRYLRYNSWDVITDPYDLATDMLYLLVHPLRSRFDWSMIICFTVLLSLLYITIKRTAKAFI